MPETLDDLAGYIRETLPQPRSIVNLHPMRNGAAVCFSWHDREFVVNPSLQTLEIKKDALFVTGASMLLQLALLKRSRNEKVLGAVVESLRQVEDMINNPLNREQGLDLLGSVKATLRKLAGK